MPSYVPSLLVHCFCTAPFLDSCADCACRLPCLVAAILVFAVAGVTIACPSFPDLCCASSPAACLSICPLTWVSCCSRLPLSPFSAAAVTFVTFALTKYRSFRDLRAQLQKDARAFVMQVRLILVGCYPVAPLMWCPPIRFLRQLVASWTRQLFCEGCSGLGLRCFELPSLCGPALSCRCLLVFASA